MKNRRWLRERNLSPTHKLSLLARSTGLREEALGEFVDEKSGRRCTSRFRLQKDHIDEFALGGATELKNLRSFCPAHNRLHALQTFGQEKMKQYIGSLE